MTSKGAAIDVAKVMPVLLISTTARLLDEARARHDTFGGDRYLLKPFDLDELLAIVHDMIDVA